MDFSLVIPTFRRPDEVAEFTESLANQTDTDFQLIFVDGTPEGSLEHIVAPFRDRLDITFIYEQGIGVSEARNTGVEAARGDYLVFIDSDCIVPPHYIAAIRAAVRTHAPDQFGGPDRERDDFTPLQKAISFSMTSVLTTGGIRGREKTVGDYHPRGFNMGIRTEVFHAVGGYSDLKAGEDIELSMRVIDAGYSVRYLPEAYVYHKRRTTLRQFYRQVYRFGAARINIWHRHPDQLKAFHAVPAAFTIGLIIALVFSAPIPWGYAHWLWRLYILYFLLILFFALARFNGDLRVALLSIVTTVTQMAGYGLGFLANLWAVKVEGRDEGIDL